MNFVSIGDLARNFQTSRHIGDAKSQLAIANQELASGRKADISTTVSGDFGPIVELERALASITSFETSASEATTLADVMQTSLTAISNQAASLAPSLLTAAKSQSETMISAAATDGMARLNSALNFMNARAAGRYAFSGMAVDSPALADAATIIADIQTSLAGLTDAASVVAAVDTWFDAPGGGYETVAYVGSTSPFAPSRVSQHETVQLDFTALDPGVREVLRGFALAALVDQGQFAGNQTERAALTQAAGEKMIGAADDLTETQARLGVAQERIATAQANSAAEKSVLQMTRAELVNADPYETATRLQAKSNQLEAIYAVTARLSRLSLVEYLR